MLVDANLLLYASLEDFPQHAAARDWLDTQLNGPRRVGLPWPALLAFMRITTNARLFTSPLSTEAAWRQVRRWLSCPSVWIPAPGERHPEILGDLLVASKATGNLVPDAHPVGTGFATPSRTFVCATGAIRGLGRTVPDGAHAPSGQVGLQSDRPVAGWGGAESRCLAVQPEGQNTGCDGALVPAKGAGSVGCWSSEASTSLGMMYDVAA